ncbi:MAG: hypothetical protein KAR21_09190 [Spirochaetales bacterium]|nr:hypothetical protein [Spirochaetales bacterium]
MSVDDYVDSLSKEYDYNDLLPSVRKELVSNGSTYLGPSFTDGHILFYRKDRVIEATAACNPSAIGAASVRGAAMLIAGLELPHDILITPMLFTNDISDII